MSNSGVISTDHQVILVNHTISRNIKLILNSIGLLVGTNVAAAGMSEGPRSVSGVSEVLGLLCMLAIGYHNE